MVLTEGDASKVQTNVVKSLDSKIKSVLLDKTLSKISLPTNLEQLDKAPCFHMPLSARKKINKKKANETAGKMWFDIPKADLNETEERDLKLLRARSGIDLRRFYRKNSENDSTKFLQIGTVVDTPEEFYSNIPKKEKPKSFVQQIIDDAETRSRIKQRHKAIVHKRSQAKKYWRKGNNKKKLKITR